MNVESVYGKCDAPGADEVEELYITVSLNPGSGTINFDKMVMEYTHTYTDVEGAVIYSSGEDDCIKAEEEFSYEGIRGVDKDRLRDNLIEQGEVYKITIDELGDLGLGEKATLKFIPEVGTPVVLELDIPTYLPTEIVELYP
jgi:archaellin